jgi:prolyl 4-hydroxylase
MAMNAHWKAWVKQSIAMGCSPHEIKGILLKHRFTVDEIRSEMGDKFLETAAAPLIDESWHNWCKTALDGGSPPIEVRDIMLKSGFHTQDIAAAMGYRFPREVLHQLTPDQYDALTRVRITRTARRVETDRVQLYVLDDFMTPQECEQLIAISSERLRPSTVARLSLYNDFRTSSTCDLVYVQHPLVDDIKRRTGQALGINPAYSEGIQVQRYEVGQQFKPHMDYFVPHTEDYEKYASVLGNRTWTFMVYLNETAKGGSTRFTNLDLSFYPKAGTALVWNNLYADGQVNPDTIHTGEPVEEGYKVIITDWYRELGEGPMIAE